MERKDGGPALSTEVEAFVESHREDWRAKADRYLRDCASDNERERDGIRLPPDRFAAWLLTMDVERAYKREIGEFHPDVIRDIVWSFVKPAWEAHWQESAQ